MYNSMYGLSHIRLPAIVQIMILHVTQTDYNYHRALIWSAVMTSLAHIDPDFGAAFAIEAVNEPIMDATQTPGYGDCMLPSSSKRDILTFFPRFSPGELCSSCSCC